MKDFGWPVRSHTEHVDGALFYGDDLEKIDNLRLYVFITLHKFVASSGWSWLTSALSCTSSSGVFSWCGPALCRKVQWFMLIMSHDSYHGRVPGQLRWWNPPSPPRHCCLQAAESQETHKTVLWNDQAPSYLELDWKLFFFFPHFGSFLKFLVDWLDFNVLG